MTIEAQAEELAQVRCAECRRERHVGELWFLLFVDLSEVAIFCPECAEREFGESAPHRAPRLLG